MFKTVPASITSQKKKKIPDCHLATNGLPVLQVFASHLEGKKTAHRSKPHLMFCISGATQHMLHVAVRVDKITHSQLFAQIIILIVNYLKIGGMSSCMFANISNTETHCFLFFFFFKQMTTVHLS